VRVAHGVWHCLAAYMLHQSSDERLEAYLTKKVFAGQKSLTVVPDPLDVTGFAAFMERYERGLVIERAAVDFLR
jgi:hypothetical protein